MKRKHSLDYSPNTTYFTTSSVTEFIHLFDREPLADIMIDNLRFYTERFAASLHGFVIMPNHFHLLLTPGDRGNISQFMKRVKEHSAKQIIEWCKEYNAQALLEIFRQSAVKYKQRTMYQVWQESFDALVVNQSGTYATKLNYIHNNPVRERWHLCEKIEDYKFSSARFYINNEDVGLPLIP